MASNPNLRRNKYGGYYLVDSSDNHMSDKRYDTGYGERDTQSGIEFPTGRELDEYRRDKTIGQYKKEAEHNNKEEKIKDTLKQKKPRRKAMKEKYKFGDTIKIDNNEYTVISTYENGKDSGYVVKDKNGKKWTINKYGEKGQW